MLEAKIKSFPTLVYKSQTEGTKKVRDEVGMRAQGSRKNIAIIPGGRMERRPIPETQCPITVPQDLTCRVRVRVRDRESLAL